jgi:hypothetical protein
MPPLWKFIRGRIPRLLKLFVYYSFGIELMGDPMHIV